MSDIKPAVVGVGTTTFGKLPGHTAADLGAWALTEALADAGISATDVDGLVTSRVGYESIAADMGLRPRWVSSLPGEGRMCGVAVHQAAAAIATGEAHTVAVVYGNDGATARATYGGAGEAYGTATALTVPYGLTSPGAFYALMLQRHRHLYGTSEEQLATISMTFREHARLNPNAVMRKPISLADYLTSRYVVQPMRLLDYCLINDGGVAMILTAGDRAHDHPKPPVHVLGVAQRAQLGNSDFPPEDFWAGATREVGDRALAQADRIRNDIDALMIYDNFSCNVLFTLEGLGYCGIGEGGAFIQGDRLAVGGPLPTNTLRRTPVRELHAGLGNQRRGRPAAAWRMRGPAGPRGPHDSVCLRVPSRQLSNLRKGRLMLEPYTDGLAAGELRTTRCTSCGTVQFPPRRVCPQCAAVGTREWITASGRGTVWSFCVFHKAYLPPPAPQPPYTVAVVQLNEGSKLITNVDTDELRIGMRVHAVYSAENGGPRVLFRPERAT